MIDANQAKTHCLAQVGAYEDFPFGPNAAVYKVMGKMFALIGDEGDDIWLKCDPVLVQLLREKYTAVTFAPYMSRKHWNAIKFDGDVPDDEFLELIEHSYELVVKKLRKADREKLANGDS